MKYPRGVHMINWMMGSEYPPDPNIMRILEKCLEDIIEYDYCELCEDGDDCKYCTLSSCVKCEGQWVPVEVLLDPCVETPCPVVMNS